MVSCGGGGALCMVLIMVLVMVLIIHIYGGGVGNDEHDGDGRCIMLLVMCWSRCNKRWMVVYGDGDINRCCLW